MLNKSVNRSKKIHRSINAAILARARITVEKYQVILQFENGEYFGRGLELPLVMADGKSADECVSKTRDALTHTVAHILAAGKQPPTPASEQIRTTQVNIRLTVTEKQRLEQLAQRDGFRGLSDYVRHSVLVNAE